MSESKNQIKFNELRIGNLLNYKVHPAKVLSIGIISLQVKANISIETVKGASDLQPIPITPEWLEKLGFVFCFGDYVKSSQSFNLIWGDESLHFQLRDYDGRWEKLSHIKHIHQLQNLVYAMTGEELEVGE